jgi:hypothetical protein
MEKYKISRAMRLFFAVTGQLSGWEYGLRVTLLFIGSFTCQLFSLPLLLSLEYVRV